MLQRFFRQILALLIASSSALSAQADSKTYGKAAFIKEMKEGVLLVRLQDKDKTIKNLEERGMTKEMELISAKQRRENEEIMLAFSVVFDFCPVYFFHSKDSEAIRQGDFSGKIFDASLQRIELSEESPIFTGEFSETAQLGIDGLIITDRQLLPLKDPLPYFQRRYVFFGLIERSKARMIELYNKKLHDYAQLYESKSALN